MQKDKNAKAILDAAHRYNKALEQSNPMEQANALYEFRANLDAFVLEVLKEQKKIANQPRSSYR